MNWIEETLLRFGGLGILEIIPLIAVGAFALFGKMSYDMIELIVRRANLRGKEKRLQEILKKNKEEALHKIIKEEEKLLRRKTKIYAILIMPPLIVGILCTVEHLRISHLLSQQIKILVNSNFDSKIYLDGKSEDIATKGKCLELYTSARTHYIRAEYNGSRFPGFYRSWGPRKIPIVSFSHIKQGLTKGREVNVKIDPWEGDLQIDIEPPEATGKAEITVKGPFSTEKPTTQWYFEEVPIGIYSVYGKYGEKRDKDLRVGVFGRPCKNIVVLNFLKKDSD